MHTLDVAFSVPFLQLPSLIPALFAAYLDEYPTSTCIYDSFVKFLSQDLRSPQICNLILLHGPERFIPILSKSHPLLYKSIHPVNFRWQCLKRFYPSLIFPRNPSQKKLHLLLLLLRLQAKKALCFSLLQTLLSYPPPHAPP